MTAPAGRRSVLFFVPDLAPGGAERVVTLFANGLDRDHFAPAICLLRRRGSLLDFLAGDVGVIPLGADHVRAAGPALIRTVWKLRPAAVVSTLAHCNLLLLALRPLLPRGTRLLVREASLPSKNLHPALQRIARVLYPTADAVLCPSLAIRDELRELLALPPRVLHHLPNPVDADRLAALSREPLPVVPAPIMAVGRLDPLKGFDILLQALAHTTLACDILGAGAEDAAHSSYGRELKRMAGHLGLGHRVRFAGHQSNPWAWMARAQCLAAPSRCEGLSNTVLEARILGLPVVASDIPGMSELVEDRTCGLLVPPDDPVALAEALELALGHPWDRAALAASARARYDAATRCRALEALIAPPPAPASPLDAGPATG